MFVPAERLRLLHLGKRVHLYYNRAWLHFSLSISSHQHLVIEKRMSSIDAFWQGPIIKRPSARARAKATELGAATFFSVSSTSFFWPASFSVGKYVTPAVSTIKISSLSLSLSVVGSPLVKKRVFTDHTTREKLL